MCKLSRSTFRLSKTEFILKLCSLSDFARLLFDHVHKSDELEFLFLYFRVNGDRLPLIGINFVNEQDACAQLVCTLYFFAIMRGETFWIGINWIFR